MTTEEDVFREARGKTAAAATSLPEVVGSLLSDRTMQKPDIADDRDRTVRRARFLEFLDDLGTRPLKPGPSVGPLSREELHQRRVPGV